MYRLDKKKFGSFLAQLRREKGFTQKELADRLYISNQAISKWETGVSIPDTALLIPLADILDISLTELLQGERISHNTNIPAPQVERLVRTIIYYPRTQNSLTTQEQYGRKIRLYLYLLFVGISGVLFFLSITPNEFSLFFREGVFLRTALLTSLFWGAYFMLFASGKYPLLGFCSTVWENIIRFGRVWCMTMLVLTPILTLILYSFWAEYDIWATLLLLIGGFLIPIFNISNKSE